MTDRIQELRELLSEEILTPEPWESPVGALQQAWWRACGAFREALDGWEKAEQGRKKFMRLSSEASRRAEQAEAERDRLREADCQECAVLRGKFEMMADFQRMVADVLRSGSSVRLAALIGGEAALTQENPE